MDSNGYYNMERDLTFPDFQIEVMQWPHTYTLAIRLNGPIAVSGRGWNLLHIRCWVQEW